MAMWRVAISCIYVTIAVESTLLLSAVELSSLANSFLFDENCKSIRHPSEKI